MAQQKRLNGLKKLVAQFEASQLKYSKYGAYDTEPDTVFQNVMIDALSKPNVKIPTGPEKWQLYTVIGCEDAARAMHDKAKEIAEYIGHTPVYEAGEFTEYLHDYCWRIV